LGLTVFTGNDVAIAACITASIVFKVLGYVIENGSLAKALY
jgi:hypothetical protein